jgi:hypothetical protein
MPDGCRPEEDMIRILSSSRSDDLSDFSKIARLRHPFNVPDKVLITISGGSSLRYRVCPMYDDPARAYLAALADEENDQEERSCGPAGSGANHQEWG